MKKTISFFRWTARIMGLAIILFAFYFLLSYLLGIHEGFGSFRNASDVFLFCCFPVSTLVGLIVAFRYESAGSLIVIIGLSILFFIRPSLAHNFFLWLPIIPAVLYLMSSFLYNKSSI